MKSPLLITGIMLVIAIFSCGKDKDQQPLEKRDQFVGRYETGYGPAKYVYDALGQHWEGTGRDTGSFTITKPVSPDSTDYVYVNGALWWEEPFRESSQRHSLRLSMKGNPVIAYVTDSSFKILRESDPYSSGNRMWSEEAFIKNNVLTITYHTFYRGYTKTSTLTLRRK